MTNRRLIVSALLVAGSALYGQASYAVPIGISTSNPYDFGWSYDSGTAAGVLSGSGTLTVGGFNTSALTVEVSLGNSSALTADRLTAFGFGIDPNATSIAFQDASDGGMINAGLSAIPSLATIEICAYGGPNCAGGGNGGILGGGFDVFTLILSGTWGSSVNIAPIGFKYQTDFGSFEFTTTDRPPPTAVAEPSTWTLFGVGAVLLGVGGLRRRRQLAV